MLWLCVFSASANAQLWEYADAKENKNKFAMGLLASIAAHELGHVIIGKAKVSSVAFDDFSITYPGNDFDDADILQTYAAGFQAQWLLSEIFLTKYERSKQKSTNLDAGLVLSTLATTLGYALVNDRRYGDIQNISATTGVSRTSLTALLAIPAAFDAWRLIGKDVPKWIPAVAQTSRGLSIAVIWTY